MGSKLIHGAGDFHIQPNPNDGESSYLMNNQGYVVLNSDGEPIEIPAGAKLEIDGAGNIRATLGEEVTEVGRIALLTPERPEALRQRDGNLFVLADGVNEADALVDTLTLPVGKQAGVRQGAVEQSNVDLTDEMAEMVQVQRAYQLSARA
ncbi:hypothetical protein HMSSN036_58560 [Paenibacillus macerans]|nr:hypothetical protein HMSSN036_58560 [Paenibacillus macerans]